MTNKQLKDELKKAVAEIKLDDELLESMRAVLEKIPECQIHGFCLSYYREWIDKMKIEDNRKQIIKALRRHIKRRKVEVKRELRDMLAGSNYGGYKKMFNGRLRELEMVERIVKDGR